MNVEHTEGARYEWQLDCKHSAGPGRTVIPRWLTRNKDGLKGKGTGWEEGLGCGVSFLSTLKEGRPDVVKCGTASVM